MSNRRPIDDLQPSQRKLRMKEAKESLNVISVGKPEILLDLLVKSRLGKDIREVSGLSLHPFFII